jgi:chromosome segregation ATPase
VTEFSIGDAFSKVIKGLRQEINGIIGEIDRSKNFTLEEMKGLLKNSLEAMVDSVEAVMSGVSDQLSVERKKKEGEESIREERIRGIEEKGGKERKKRELEKRHYDGKMEKFEQKEQEREEKVRSLKERMETMEREAKKERMEVERIVGKMEERLLQVEKGEKERERMEADIREHRVRMEEKRRNDTVRKEILKAQESEKEMEKKVGAAMEQVKILDLDFGKLIEKKEVIEKAAIELIQENVKLSDRQEWEWNIKRSRVYVLGKTTKEKEFEGRKIFTVPILIRCSCAGDKQGLERIIRNAGIRVSFHWPTEMLEYVKGIRERVEGMGRGGREEFVRVRAVREEGELFLRADVRRKEGGRFRWVGDWKCPPLDRVLWDVAIDILKPYCRSADVGNRN